MSDDVMSNDVMSDDKGINTGPNSRPLNAMIAGTGPGIADDALAPDEEMPTAPTDEEVAAAARELGAPLRRRNARFTSATPSS